MRLFACYLLITLFVAVSVCFGQTDRSSRPIMQKLPENTASKDVDASQGLIEGKVVRVLDGDTINLQSRDRVIHTVRLQGVDAPEEKQPFGKKSRKNLEELILDKDVKVVVHKKDQGGRFIGSVYLLGRDVGLLQIEWGMAWHYKLYGYEQTAASRKTYALAEATARTDRMGLWEKPDAMPPWEYRGEMKPPEPVIVKSATPPPSVPAATSEKKYKLGPRGGCYYVSPSGRKVYVPEKSLCAGISTGVKQ